MCSSFFEKAITPTFEYESCTQRYHDNRIQIGDSLKVNFDMFVVEVVSDLTVERKLIFLNEAIAQLVNELFLVVQ